MKNIKKPNILITGNLFQLIKNITSIFNSIDNAEFLIFATCKLIFLIN